MQEAENGMGEALKKQATAPFSPFEWLLSLRYLRARRREGFISVIAGFSFVGIMLGVATLIIVMSVMNGFRIELLGKILGLNGHMMVRGYVSDISDFDERVASIRQVDGVTYVSPLVEGQVMASSANGGSGVTGLGAGRVPVSQLSVFQLLTSYHFSATDLVSDRSRRPGLGPGRARTARPPRFVANGRHRHTVQCPGR